MGGGAAYPILDSFTLCVFLSACEVPGNVPCTWDILVNKSSKSPVLGVLMLGGI